MRTQVDKAASMEAGAAAQEAAAQEAKPEEAAEKKVASVEMAVEETAVAMVMEKTALCSTRRREEQRARERPFSCSRQNLVSLFLARCEEILSGSWCFHCITAKPPTLVG